MPTTLSSVKTAFNSPSATLYGLRKGGGIVKATDNIPNYPSGATDIKLSYLNGASPIVYAYTGIFNFHVSENQYNSGAGYSFSMAAGVNDQTFYNTDGGNAWLIGAATGFYIDTGAGYCKCIFTDEYGISIEVIRMFSELYLLFDRVGTWNDRIRSIRVVRLYTAVSLFAGFWDSSGTRISISTDGVGAFLSGDERPNFTVTFTSSTTASFYFPDGGTFTAIVSGNTITFNNGGTWSRVGFS